jgi:hypothetical protein
VVPSDGIRSIEIGDGAGARGPSSISSRPTAPTHIFWRFEVTRWDLPLDTPFPEFMQKLDEAVSRLN